MKPASASLPRNAAPPCSYFALPASGRHALVQQLSADGFTSRSGVMQVAIGEADLFAVRAGDGTRHRRRRAVDQNCEQQAGSKNMTRICLLALPSVIFG